MLVQELVIDHAEHQGWREQVERGDCPGEPWNTRPDYPERWWTLPLDGTPPRSFASEVDARREWDGARLVTFACGDTEALDPYQLARDTEGECDGRIRAVDLRIGGVTIAADPGLEFLGFVETAVR